MTTPFQTVSQCSTRRSVRQPRRRCGTSVRCGGAAAVIAVDQPGSRYAGTVALLIAATRLADDIADAEGWARLLPGVATRPSQRRQQQAQRVVASPVITLEAIAGPIRQQAAVEQQGCHDFAVYAAPTKAAVGAAFRQTALPADQPANEATLDRIGRMYGRIIYLLDSDRDYATDQARDRFNALAHGVPSAALSPQARQIFTQAHAELSKCADCGPICGICGGGRHRGICDCDCDCDGGGCCCCGDGDGCCCNCG